MDRLVYFNRFQAWIGSDKSFTYDYVFDTASQQEEVYEDTVKGLVDGTFEGKCAQLDRQIGKWMT